MQLTQTAIDLIAKVESRIESDINRLRQAKVPFITIITDGRKPTQQIKKTPADFTRRKYTRWGGGDSNRLWDGQNKRAKPLIEDYNR